MTDQTPPRRTSASRSQQRKQMLLRLDPAVHDALARWASDELRSANAQIEFLLRRALAEAGRLPGAARPIPRRGRPPNQPPGQPPEEPETPPGTGGQDAP
ncbi:MULTISPECIES: hypothetical protein [Streptomyces]|uniref:Toxin-antitoxin system HicB family antitoxin n=1 Tax=Streptomyces rubiginosohelvolus TaxID=67362 RepID=A0ABQ3BEA5_9ACTN|nr:MULTISPECIES: hypothetical protein [Streptomyces]GGR72452.1 hypothetical protein GCM10010284_01030 [Streptomyces rubiginosohelvolus]GGZ36377.1 hypothetical protein GCM10010328_07440 [Streptomyces pluricolorescens]